MKILSSTQPQVVPNLYECVCFEHKGRYSEEFGKQSSIFFPTLEVNGAPKQPGYKLSSKYLPLCSEQFWGTIDFHSREKNTALFPKFFRISSFVFSRTNTFIQVWKYLRLSKL